MKPTKQFCQVENCNWKATHTKTETFEFDHTDIKGKYHQIQLCVIKTNVCQMHKDALDACQVSIPSFDTL